MVLRWCRPVKHAGLSTSVGKACAPGSNGQSLEFPAGAPLKLCAPQAQLLIWRTIPQLFWEIMVEKKKAETVRAPEGALQLETGALSKEEVDAIMNALPVDVTFVDKEDTVRYFNKAGKRIFARTKAVIGRKVQQCHPQKSVHVVNKILESFKDGKKDMAEFWIQMHNRLVYIRYFAVRDKDGKYLGTLEVTQDITDIEKIEGEKRLLDWEG